MKFLLIIGFIFIGQFAMANQSADDIKTILNDGKVKALIGEGEISSIVNKGQRNYGIMFADCAVIVNVLSACAPIPGGPCAAEVRFNSGSVSCLP